MSKVILCFLLFVIVRGECRRSPRRPDETIRNQQDYGSDYNPSSGLPAEHGRIDGATLGPESKTQSGLFTNEKKNSRPLGSLRGNRDGEDLTSRPEQEGPNQRSSGFFIKQKENDYSGNSHGQRPSSSASNDYYQELNQQSTESYNNEYNQRPNQQFGSNNQRPNQQQSTESYNNEYNQRPNQQFGSNNQRPNQQSTESYNNEYNQRPNQQFGSNNQRPNQQQSTESYNNEYNQRPNQQFGSNNQRPNQQQSTESYNNEYNQRPNQQFGSNNQRPSQQSFGSHNNVNQKPSPQSETTSNKTDSTKEKEVCYGIFGCFSLLEPWTSKLRPIPGPLPPENNFASMYFYSRPNTQQKYLVNVYPQFSLGEAKFNPRRPTVIIIHGYIQDGNELWMEEMKNAYLKHVDANVMLVDWGKGSKKLSYLQAAGNTRLIGTMIGFLIKRLIYEHGADARQFHLIGHSLGAQIASYAGKEVPGIGRLTALDPAQPGFEGFDKRVRLDKSDAEFVDVMHTNAKPFIPTFGLGMIKSYGHVDFYMNGGFDQPLCVSPAKNSLKEIKSIIDLANLPADWFGQTISCDHNRAHAYMTEAINNTDCIFWGHKASAKNIAQTVAHTLTQGLLSKYVALSTSCSKEDCVPMGLATKESPLRGSFVVTTNGKFPYCRSEPGIPAEKPSQGRKESNRDQRP